MQNILALLFLVFFISSCTNSGWDNVAEGTDKVGGKFTIALDRSDVTDFGDIKTAWARKSFTSPKALKDGSTYTETYIFFAVDCKNRKYSVMEIGMSNPGSTEFVHAVKFADDTDNLVWSPVPDTSPSREIYKELCSWYSSLF